MNIKQLLGVAAVATTGLWAWADAPSITLNRVQQRYPWNGLVDIDYTVSGVDDPADYYVRFTVTTNGASTGFACHEFLNDDTLLNASNGSYRVTWESASDLKKFFSKGVSVDADLVYSPGDKSDSPYAQYMIIDLSGGSTATSYPVSHMTVAKSAIDATFNIDEYKLTKLVLRRIRAGTFIMGSPDDEEKTVPGSKAPQYQHKETQHQVTLTKDYYIGVFPVTQQQYYQVMNANPSKFKGTSYPGCEKAPVEYLYYKHVRGANKGLAVPITGEVDEGTFLYNIRLRSGVDTLELPTAAQWEYAVRAGTTGSTYFGNNVIKDAELLGRYCWYSGNSGSRTHSVGEKLPNPWGLYDMLGNTFEFCLDHVVATTSGDCGTEAVVDPLVQNGPNIPMFGGSWGFGADCLRCAMHFASDATTASGGNQTGFRLANNLK